jgi:hypothetical protein
MKIPGWLQHVYFFNYLKRNHINTVLQGYDAPDDGSLSYYAMKHYIPYANIEVQFGHEAIQLKLIHIVNNMIKGYLNKYMYGIHERYQTYK